MVFAHFQDDRQTGSSNRLSSIAHSHHSHRLIQPNESEVSITVIPAQKNKVFNHAKLSVHK